METRGIKFWAFLALVMLAPLAGCGDEETKIVTPEPAIKLSVTAESDSLVSGGAVTVIPVVTTDVSGPFTFDWTADGGSFSDAGADTTVWTAPDDPGLYTLSVVVSNGTDVAIGSTRVGVGTYTPTVTPFYRGVAYCATCHNGGTGGDQFAHWSEHGHANAIETLEAIGQADNPFCNQCHTVGTYGAVPDTLHQIANGGFDETHVMRLADVQCENCHGPGSEHPQPDFNSVVVTMEASLCGQCHSDIHHPTFEEWQSSGHSGVIASPSTRAGCAHCHNGLVGDDYLDDPLNPPTEAPTEAVGIVCATCHDPHGNDNPGDLRNASVTDIALPNGDHPQAGAGRLCISCHNGRRTPEDAEGMILNGNARFGPHHSVQGDMLAGVDAYEAVAPEGFHWASSKHILIQDACIGCHTHPHAGDPNSGIANFTGHDFQPHVEACQPCHGNLADFDDVRAKRDYDGDGQVEGVQSEVDGLAELLRETIIEVSATPETAAALEENFEGSIGVADVTTMEQRAAGYNLLFVEFDQSHGVHNAAYAVQLLQQSILFLDPNGLPAGADVLRQGN